MPKRSRGVQSDIDASILDKATEYLHEQAENNWDSLLSAIVTPKARISQKAFADDDGESTIAESLAMQTDDADFSRQTTGRSTPESNISEVRIRRQENQHLRRQLARARWTAVRALVLGRKFGRRMGLQPRMSHAPHTNRRASTGSHNVDKATQSEDNGVRVEENSTATLRPPRKHLPLVAPAPLAAPPTLDPHSSSTLPTSSLLPAPSLSPPQSPAKLRRLLSNREPMETADIYSENRLSIGSASHEIASGSASLQKPEVASEPQTLFSDASPRYPSLEGSLGRNGSETWQALSPIGDRLKHAGDVMRKCSSLWKTPSEQVGTATDACSSVPPLPAISCDCSPMSETTEASSMSETTDEAERKFSLPSISMSETTEAVESKFSLPSINVTLPVEPQEPSIHLFRPKPMWKHRHLVEAPPTDGGRSPEPPVTIMSKLGIHKLDVLGSVGSANSSPLLSRSRSPRTELVSVRRP